MAIKVVMPQLGITTLEGTIVRWLKKEGDTVKQGEPLFEVMTDKVTTTVEAPGDGILRKILVPEGAVAKITQVVAIIASAEEDLTPILTEVGIEEKEVEKSIRQEMPSKAPISDHEKASPFFKISPLAKKIAKEAGISVSELAAIKGSGPGGSIVKRDVLSFLASRATVKEEKFIEQPITTPSALGEKVIPLTPMRRAIAQRMTQSSHDAPQFWLGVEVEADELLKWRQALNARLAAGDEKLTITDFIIKACALSLREHPYLNASYTPDGLVIKENINIGVAVALSDGLIVPVVKDADRKTLREIAKERAILVDAARAGKLTTENVTGGTFTVSNLGMYGIDEFVAIINPPEAGIIAIGCLRDSIRVSDNQIKTVKTFSIRLTLDHRVVDGAQGARFLQSLKQRLEDPYYLLL